jgi:nucleoside-diphosphate-sugar epimerase
MKRVVTGVDIVYHEATICSVPRPIANSISTNEAGVTGTLIILLAARDGRAERLVYASSFPLSLSASNGDA